MGNYNKHMNQQIATSDNDSSLNAPAIAKGYNTLLNAIRSSNTLPGHVRELMVSSLGCFVVSDSERTYVRYFA